MFKVIRVYVSILLFLSCVCSCNRVKQKSREVVENAKAKLADKKADVEDKIVTHYDAFNPDTRFNKQRFQDLFGFTPTADVKELYCHADEMGIDHDYQFSFSCDTSTVSKIVSRLKLTMADKPDNFSSGLWHSFFGGTVHVSQA